jgi:hypothetical protein
MIGLVLPNCRLAGGYLLSMKVLIEPVDFLMTYRLLLYQMEICCDRIK